MPPKRVDKRFRHAASSRMPLAVDPKHEIVVADFSRVGMSRGSIYAPRIAHDFEVVVDGQQFRE